MKTAPELVRGGIPSCLSRLVLFWLATFKRYSVSPTRMVGHGRGPISGPINAHTSGTRQVVPARRPPGRRAFSLVILVHSLDSIQPKRSFLGFAPACLRRFFGTSDTFLFRHRLFARFAANRSATPYGGAGGEFQHELGIAAEFGKSTSNNVAVALPASGL